MALTVRTNGTGSVNQINAQWFNDYHDLLTGTMTDQPVSITDNVALAAIGAAPGVPTLAVQAAGSVDVGAHTYAVTFASADGGETTAGTTAVATTTTGNQTVALSVIPTGPTGTTARKVYRSKAGTTSPLYLLTTLNDNTTTVYSDTATDASLPTTTVPVHPSFGGSLSIKNSAGAVKAQVFSDGAVSLDGGAITSDGAGNLTAPVVHGTADKAAALSGSTQTLTASDTWGFPKDSGNASRAMRFGAAFSGTGAGTFSHGMIGGQTPNVVAITSNQANSSQTVGVDTLGASSVHINMPNAWPWLGLVART